MVPRSTPRWPTGGRNGPLAARAHKKRHAYVLSRAGGSQLVFASSTPAANAPAVSVRPSSLAIVPMPTETSRQSATNVSAELPY
eukprot:2721430-Prymnesium_polylepis.1